MKKSFKNILSAAALLMLTATSAFADGDENKGIVANKTVTDNGNGKYTLTLETYAEGEGSATTTTVSQPLDIVLVLDMSGSMDNDFSDQIDYFARPNQSYTYSSLNGTYYYLYEGEYYKLTRAYDDWALSLTTPFRNCYIYFTVGTTRYYLSGNDVTTTKKTFSNNNTTIWTGVLYENRNKTRLDALKESVSSFIREVESKSTDDATHQIAIVTFADTGNSKNVSNGLSSDFDGLKDIVSNLQANGGTYPGEAMEKANTILSGVPVTRKSSKLVVMFTDGVPAGNRNDPTNEFSNDNKKEANNTIGKSLTLKNNKVSYQLNEDKTYTAVGITVFSVGIFTDPFADIVDYMNYVSSNYPSAESMTSGGSPAAEQKYSFTASSAEALDDIFTSIAQTATEGAGSTSYTKENSDVRDFITPQFKLAEGQGVSAISVQYVPCNPSNNTTTVDWLTPVSGASKGITAEAGTKGEDGITPVIIKGYDFKENWVGAYMEGTTVRGWHEGGKLVITIDIELDPEYEAAGVITTNTEDSGIYYQENKEVDFEETGITFPVPITVNKEYALLHIVKNGLGSTESAIFDVKVGDSIINTVMVNALTENEAYVKVNWLTDAAKIKSFDSEHPLAEGDMIQFTVEERTNWSWNASTPSSASTSALYTIASDGTITPVDFKFGVGSPKTNNVNHDEESTVIEK